MTIKQELGDRTLLCTLQLIRNMSVFRHTLGLMTQVKCYFEVLLMHEQEKNVPHDQGRYLLITQHTVSMNY